MKSFWNWLKNLLGFGVEDTNNDTQPDAVEPETLPSVEEDVKPRTLSTIKLGSKGEDVAVLQQKLKDLGYNVGNVDGHFGPKTHAAVEQFQSEMGLVVDGIVGARTWATINLDNVNSKPSNESNEEHLDVSDRIHAEAMSYLGEKEIYGSKHNPVIQDFFKEVLGERKPDEWAWCGAFVGAVLKRCGLESTPKDVCLMARSYLKYGKSVDASEVKKGDIVVFWRSSPSSWKGHVAFFDHFDGSNVYVLGGNQGNKVSIAKYSKSRVLDYRRPIVSDEISIPTIEESNEYSFKWKNKDWDKWLVDALRKSNLIKFNPKDKTDFGKESDMIKFWGNILTEMAYWESKWNPGSNYKESFGVWSRGLFQLSLSDHKNYKMNLGWTKEEDVNDPKTNIEAAVIIMDKLVSQDNRIAGKESGKWKGGARYWAVLRGSREYTEKALNSIKKANS